MAYGFGNNVPLAFACRQIVALAVTISFGPGVNPTGACHLERGEKNHVLRDTVTPLGMHPQMTHMAVDRKNPAN